MMCNRFLRVCKESSIILVSEMQVHEYCSTNKNVDLSIFIAIYFHGHTYRRL